MARTVNARGYAIKMQDGWHAGIEWPDGRRQCVTTGNATKGDAEQALRKWVADQGGHETPKH